MDKKNSSSWNIKFLLFAHALVALLIVSLFWPKSNFIWKPLDEGCFRLCNSLVKESFFWQNFWAMANHRFADWVEDVCFILFFTWIITATPKQDRIKKIAECIFTLLYTAAIILMANEVIFRVMLHVQRSSPTLTLDNFTNLADHVTWLKVKTKSIKSFPGDHATTAILFIANFLYLARKNHKIALAAVAYGIFLCMPRLITGAHWLTDILIGSGSIAFIFLSWAFCTPLASKSIYFFEKAIRFVSHLVRPQVKKLGC